VDRWTLDPKLGFPKPVKYGGRIPLYDLGDLEKWERARAKSQNVRRTAGAEAAE
jgi:hypothetical protein